LTSVPAGLVCHCVEDRLWGMKWKQKDQFKTLVIIQVRNDDSVDKGSSSEDGKKLIYFECVNYGIC
jgi:hypothetical protein